MSPRDTVEVIDLGEASALLTLGFNLLGLENSTDRRHKIFIFEKLHPNSSPVNVERTLDDYNCRRLNVDAYSFFRAIKDLKNRIHEHSELMMRQTV